MFKIPEWDDDSPNKNAIFAKKANVKKDHTLPHLRTTFQVNSAKVINKVKAKDNVKSMNKISSLNNVKKSVIKSKHTDVIIKPLKKKVASDIGVDIQKFDLDKADQVLCDQKKKRLYDVIKQDDQEDILFGEKKEKLPKVKTKRKKLISPINSAKLISQGDIIDMRATLEKNKFVFKNTSLSKEDKEHLKDKLHFRNELKKKIITKQPYSNLVLLSSDDDLDLFPEKTLKKSSQQENKSHERLINYKINVKKEKLRKLLVNKVVPDRTPIKASGGKLREKMITKLKVARFRYLNEKLYTSSGTEALQFFQSDPVAFQAYHQGYQQQLKQWPINPLDIIIKKISKLPKTHIIADMGCGEALLSKRVSQAVRSFDLVASGPEVEACDMAHTPLLSGSVDVVVYCLALMGTDLTRYLMEANRVLKLKGQLIIAEVESRFGDVDSFARDVAKLGFRLRSMDKTHSMFLFFHFTKTADTPKRAKLPMLTLKPCMYKKR